MKIHPRLFKEISHEQYILILSIILSLGGGIMGILQARQVSWVINQVFLEQHAFQMIFSALGIILAFVILRAGLSWAGEVCASTSARQIKQELRNRLFSHILNLGPGFLRGEAGEAQTRTGELVTTATEGIDALEIYFSQYLPQIALAGLIPIAILFFVFPIDLLSGLIFLLTAPLLPLFMYLIGSMAEALTRKQWQGLGRMGAYFLDVLQGLTTLKTLGRSREQIEVIRKVSRQYRHSTMKVLRVTFLSALVLELIATLSTAVLAVEIGVRLLYGKLAFEQAIFLLILAPEFYQPLRLLGTRFHAGMAGVEAARRLFAILDLPAVIHPLRSNPDQPPQGNRLSTPPSISLKDVSYTYSNGRVALERVSFEIPSGTFTALVGESGAGKTTLTWMLMRFLEPQDGQILINDQSLAELSPEQWLGNLAWVPQNPHLFNDTILANIKFAKPQADDTAVIEAARQAYAEEFIQALPMGYQTNIGERGVKLSAGQAQRIALARAFLKDAPMLILDEATSHLDPETDSLVRASLRNLSVGRTVLVIAHHQNTLSMADQVVRLSHGRVMSIHRVDGKPAANPHLVNAYSLLSGHSTQADAHPGEFTPIQKTSAPRQRLPVEKRLLKLLAPYVGSMLLSVFLGLATVASGIGLMATAAYVISAAALHPSIAELQVAIVGVRFFGLSRGIFRYLERLVSHDTTLRLLESWRTWFYGALEPLAPGRLLGYHTGDLLSRAISDIGSLENFYVRAIAPPFVAVLVVAGIVIFLGDLGRQLASTLLIFILLAGVGLPLLALVSSHRLGPKIVSARAGLSTLLVDGIQGSADIVACGQAGIYVDRIRLASEKLSRLQTHMAILSSLHSTLTNLFANLGMLAVLASSISMVEHMQLDGVLIGTVTLAALTCFEALQPLPQAALYYAANRSAAARLYELVDTSPLVTDPPEPLALPANTDVEIQDVSFQYPIMEGEASLGRPGFRLYDIAFSLPQGKHVVVVGPSGSGKSTLVNLLVRFWDYSQGSILFGGQELRQYRQADLCKWFSVVTQNTYIFSATIRENLLIARPQASEAELIQAARKAQLHGFVSSLPDGYNTWVGEHGMQLSTGERQRLAVARALLKDAPLLILDEPTANLDPSTEAAMFSSIRELCIGRSTLTITQSIISFELMDEILVLQNGRIVERGTHADLLTKHGQYRRMWDQYHQLI